MFMFSHKKRSSSLSRSRHRKVSRRFQVECLEGRALLALTALNFGATVASTPVVMNGELFFVGFDAVHGDQLWESNGTAAGTTRLSDGNDVNGGIEPNDLTVVGSTLYFAANDLTHGGQLWKSDGTAAGTTYVTDSNDGVPNAGLYPSQLINANGALYFTAPDHADGTQLFTSDGTASGTAMVKDIPGASGYAGSYPANLTAAGGLLFFSATDSAHGNQLWESNGTSSGTTMLTSGSGGTSPQFLAAIGGTVYFSGYDATNHFQVWDSNGTASGTQRLTSGGSSGLGLNPQSLTAAGSTVYFSATDGTHGAQLWSFTGTSPGSATMLSSGNVKGGGVAPDDLAAVGSAIYFAGNDGVHGDQLWSSTGTAAGTAMVADINGTSTADVTNLINMNGTLYFAAYTTKYGYQVWQSNGTSSGTVMDTHLNTGSSSTPTNFVTMGTTLSFTAPGATMWQWQSSKITPTITWAAPAGIVYGTALSATQLDATASVPGTFAYSPAAGTVLKAGSGQALSVSFTPTDSTDYTGATGTTTINVAQATPTITWASPAGIVYGTALSGTQLDATASVPGTFAYSPASGTVPKAGSDTLSVTFTPTDTTDYATQTATATLVVSQATPTITWASPAGIVYGTPLSSAQLDATASVPGTFAYSPALGTLLGAGSGEALSVSFTPTDTTDYTAATGTATINVTQATPTITWASPAGIVYGTALSAAQLDATASVPGTFAYSPALGTLLGVGKGQALSVSFTPNDTTDYSNASASTAINVAQATPTITWASPAGIVYGTALSATQLDAIASVPGTFTYSPPIGTVLGAGSGEALSVTFTPNDTTDYTGATASTAINVAQATPTITWPSPASIYHGAPLGATQLDATANVPGTFTYTPPAGTVLGEGSGQTLSATFKPSDSTDYSITSATTTINVLAASASFVKTDTTTQGNWIGVYGSNGAEVIPDTPDLPSYATVSPSGYLTYIATTQTTDVRALQNPGGVGRVSACWFSVTSFTVSVNLNDGQSHVLSLYACDWGLKGRVEQIQISDAATGAVLNTQTISSFTGGAYLTWAVGGNVVITVTNLAGPNAVLTGIFFDPPGTSQPSSTQAGIATQAKAIGSSSGPAPSGIGTLDFLGDSGPAMPGAKTTAARADSKVVPPLSASQGRGAALEPSTFSNRSLITGSSSRWSSATSSGPRPGFVPVG